VAQVYAPAEVVGHEYYQPTSRGAEAVTAHRLVRIRAALRGDPPPTGAAPATPPDDRDAAPA
jgi:hypothetical protein